MASEIERFLFGEPVVVHFVTRFEFSKNTVSAEFLSFDCEKRLVAKFENAEIVTVEQDREEGDSLMLDIIGFDSYPFKGSWQFVLNCGSVEWSWNSSWPTIQDS
ncbi:MAG TPA: hypothetical protein VFP40_17065 [Terriglobales bacterium]|nr:hypothetical protein [Terriglobales bacterium]